MTAPRLSIHDRMVELADTTRCRLLAALERQELTVGELAQALQLPQSTVSRHLKILADQAWIASRAEGASRWYRRNPRLDADMLGLWELVCGMMILSQEYGLAWATSWQRHLDNPCIRQGSLRLPLSTRQKKIPFRCFHLRYFLRPRTSIQLRRKQDETTHQ
jgi:DNA-binding transcriptional ArsR family regulator